MRDLFHKLLRWLVSDRSDLYEMGKDIEKIVHLLRDLHSLTLRQGAQIMAKLSDFQAATALILAAVGALQTQVGTVQETIDAEQGEIEAALQALRDIIEAGEFGPEADALLVQLQQAADKIGAASQALANANVDLAGTIQNTPEVGPSAPPPTPEIVAGSNAENFKVRVGITDAHSETLLRVDNGGTGTFTDFASFPPSFDFPDPKPTFFDTVDIPKAAAGVQIWKAVNTKDGLFSTETETVTTEDGVVVP